MSEQVPSKELDDCPRCGGDPGLVFNHPAIGPSYVWVKCECGLRGIEHEYHHGDEKEAIAAARAWWNERRSHESPADDLYLMLVRRGYPQHEADEIARMTARIESGRPAQPPVATPATESGLIRYDIRPGFPDEIEFNFDPNGEWVRFDDVWPELQQLRARASQPPAPARQPSKFDLAFEIMRQLEAEDMETMQSCQFGYVMRVTKEGHGCGQVEFRPIETAPKDGSTILLRCPKGIVEGCWEQVDGGGHPENGPPVYWWTSPFTEFIDGPYDAPTHWALIPRDALTKGANDA